MGPLRRMEDGVYVKLRKEHPDYRQFRVIVSPEWPIPPGAPQYRVTCFLGGEGVRPKTRICPIPPAAAPTGEVRMKIALALPEAPEPEEQPRSEEGTQALQGHVDP